MAAFTHFPLHFVDEKDGAEKEEIAMIILNNGPSMRGLKHVVIKYWSACKLTHYVSLIFDM